MLNPIESVTSQRNSVFLASPKMSMEMGSVAPLKGMGNIINLGPIKAPPITTEMILNRRNAMNGPSEDDAEKIIKT